jgi:ATP-binding cassette subfamily F protein 3
MIQLDNLTLFLGTRCIFEKACFTIFPGQKVGVIGKNGAGKSTLFALLRNELLPDKGHCQTPKSWRIAHIPQNLPEGSITALDYVLSGDNEYLTIQNKLMIAEQNDDHSSVLQAHDQLHLIDGYRIPAKAANLLKGLGFSDPSMQQAISSFSGGWRMRLNVAKTLMARADLFLLDEPTNHLDLDAIVWLEEWIKNCHATVLVITHDAAFLDAVPENILLVENKQFTVYKGNYSSYIAQKSATLALQQAMYLKQQKTRAHLQNFIDRFRAKASKAKQAQSRIKALERLPDLAAVQEQSAFQFEFTNVEHCPNPLLNLENIEFAYPEAKSTVIFKKLNFSIRPGSRIALLGLNGAGKSTLMKLLAGSHSPQKGTRQIGPGLKIGYFAQEQAETFPTQETPFHWFEKLATNATQKEIRTYLGRFAFSDERALQKISSLSGGERARLALAWIVWQKPHLLLLDEPTNHLDLEMRQALALALQSFSGAMVQVSHDRQLIMNTADELWWVHNGTVEPFVGDLQDYEQKLKKARKLLG